MSHRPSPTKSRPWGSTGGNKGTRTREARIGRAKRHQMSPYPLTAVTGKHLSKQGFPNTMGRKG
jgi:hypothetical protein